MNYFRRGGIASYLGRVHVLLLLLAAGFAHVHTCASFRVSMCFNTRVYVGSSIELALLDSQRFVGTRVLVASRK